MRKLHEPGTQAVIHGISRNLEETNFFHRLLLKVLSLLKFSLLMHRQTLTPDFKRLRGLLGGSIWVLEI